jgi:3-hydroxybutyryl-CoA dehydrogenase
MTNDVLAPVAVLGLGTMGHGIAQAFAAAGYPVRGYDDEPRARASLHERVRQNLADFVAAGLTAEEDIEPILSRITVADTEGDALRGAWFVTEAVREDLPTKQELFARIEAHVSDEAILASNSSTFPMSQSATRMRRPERAIVTHWFNPPHIVPTVEIVPGPRTDPAVTERTVALLRQLGKLAIPIRQELPGFLVNRVQVAVMREVWDLLDRGVASAEEIDAAIRGSMGFRLAAAGPLQIHDFGGLDIQAAVFRNLAPEINSGTEVPETVQRLVDGGNYGPKTGRGFYEYPSDEVAAIRSERDRKFLALLRMFYARNSP